MLEEIIDTGYLDNVWNLSVSSNAFYIVQVWLNLVVQVRLLSFIITLQTANPNWERKTPKT